MNSGGSDSTILDDSRELPEQFDPIGPRPIFREEIDHECLLVSGTQVMKVLLFLLLWHPLVVIS